MNFIIRAKDIFLDPSKFIIMATPLTTILIILTPLHPSIKFSTEYFIVLFFSLIIFCIWIAGKRNLKKISSLTDRLSSSISYLNKKSYEQEEADTSFSNRYLDINNFFIKKQKGLDHIWHEFKEHLLETKDDKGNTIRTNSIRPSAFFNQEAIFLENEIDEHSISGVSSKFVALGVSGTFLGLVFGIFSLTILLSDNPGDLVDGVKKMLGGAWIAFMTSFLGVLSSSCFSYYREKVFNKFDKELHNLNVILERSLKFRTKEQISHDSFKVLKNQEQTLMEIDAHLNTKLDEAPTKIANELAPILVRIEDFIKNLGNSSNQIIDKNFQSSSSKLETLIDKMSLSMDKILEIVPNSVESMKTGGKQMQESLQKSLKSLATSSEEVKENMKEVLEKSLSETTNIQESFKKEMIETQDAFHTKNSQGINLLQDSVFSLSSSIEKIEKLSQAFGDKAQKENEALGNLIRLSHRTEENINKVEPIAKSLDSLSDRLNAFSEQSRSYISEIHDLNESMKNLWERYEKRFEGIDENLSDFFKNFEEGVSGSVKRLHENFNEIQKGTKGVCNAFAAAVEDLREQFEEMKNS